MLPILHPQSTAAAALTRPAAIRRAGEGRSADLRAAASGATVASPCGRLARGLNKPFGGIAFGSKPELCRMPSALLTLDPSTHQQEGSP